MDWHVKGIIGISSSADGMRRAEHGPLHSSHLRNPLPGGHQPTGAIPQGSGTRLHETRSLTCSSVNVVVFSDNIIEHRLPYNWLNFKSSFLIWDCWKYFGNVVQWIIFDQWRHGRSILTLLHQVMTKCFVECRLPAPVELHPRRRVVQRLR